MDKQQPLLQRVATGIVGLEVPESMIYMCYLTVFIDILAACISTPVMPYYAQSFGAPVEWIGYLYGAWSFSATVFAPMLSGLSDKWGRKFVLVACLLGAGSANLIQGSALFLNDLFPGMKPGFWVFLFGRGFSGVWASVGATCNVYISDVAPSKSVREPYLEKMAIVPIVAILLGPGLGGGLAAAFGNNVPILADSAITLFSACVVMYNLVETPSFVRSKEEAESARVHSEPAKESVKVRGVVHLFGFAAFIMAIAGQINTAMHALFFQKVHKFSTLYIGFMYMGMAVCMLLSNLLLRPLLKNKLQLSPTFIVMFGGSVQGFSLLCLSLQGSHWYHIACLCVGALFGALVASQNANIVSGFTDITNRGKIFGLMQTYQNCGKIVGPILATHVAMRGLFGIGIGSGFVFENISHWTDEKSEQHPFGLPYVIGGTLYIVAQFFVYLVAQSEKTKVEVKESEYGEGWADESGNDQDKLRLGAFVAKLLSERHYLWVSQKDQVESFLTELIPVLEVKDKESYQQSFELAQSTVTA